MYIMPGKTEKKKKGNWRKNNNGEYRILAALDRGHCWRVDRKSSLAFVEAKKFIKC